MPDKSPYSFHTFIFPFIWEVSDKNKSPIDAFEACLREEWREERGRYGNGGEKNLFARLAENYRFNLSGTDLTREQREALVYNEYKYFHESARKALYDFGPGNKEEILRSYFWPIKVSRNTDTENKPVLGIVKGQDVFRLYVNSIELKVYATGVALIILQGEYYGRDGENNCFDDVLKINQYVRRLWPPFINVKALTDYSQDKCSELADKVWLEVTARKFLATTTYDTYYYFEENFSEVFQSPSCVVHYLSKIILGLLGDKFRIEGSSEDRNNSVGIKLACAGLVGSAKRSQENKGVKIRPIIDDRMFVVSVVRDQKLVDDAGRWLAGRDCYYYQYDCFWSNRLKIYQFMFVDAVYATCQDRKMRLELMNRHCYPRFIEWGTLYGITHQAFVCLTGEGDFAKDVISAHMLTMYTQMAVLALVQRASLIHFNDQTAKLSHVVPGTDDEARLFNINIGSYTDLIARYYSFENQIMNFEITAQEQGIELYEKLRESLYIKEEAEQLRQQLNIVQDMAENIMAWRSETKISVLTVLGVVIGFLTLVQDRHTDTLGVGKYVIGAIILACVFLNSVLIKLFEWLAFMLPSRLFRGVKSKLMK